MKLTNLSIGFTFRINKNMSLRVNFNKSRNMSNINTNISYNSYGKNSPRINSSVSYNKRF